VLVVALLVLFARLLHAAQLLQQVGRDPVGRRCRPQCRAVVRRRRTGVSRLFEAVAFHHQRADVARIEREHAVDGGAIGSPATLVRCFNLPYGLERSAGIAAAEGIR
jgi:hypothetical protein